MESLQKNVDGLKFCGRRILALHLLIPQYLG